MVLEARAQASKAYHLGFLSVHNSCSFVQAKLDWVFKCQIFHEAFCAEGYKDAGDGIQLYLLHYL